jgi:hypothetical protein
MPSLLEKLSEATVRQNDWQVEVLNEFKIVVRKASMRPVTKIPAYAFLCFIKKLGA